MWRQQHHHHRLPADLEGLLPRAAGAEPDVLRYTPPFSGNLFLFVIVLVFLSLGVVPASLVLWVCLGIFFASTCIRLGHMEQLSLDQAQQPGSSMAAPPGGPYALPLVRSGHLGSGAAMLLLPPGSGLLHLSMMDREWAPEGHPAGRVVLASAAHHRLHPNMLTEQDLLRLATHVHGSNCLHCGLGCSRPRPSHCGAAGCGSSAAARSDVAAGQRSGAAGGCAAAAGQGGGAAAASSCASCGGCAGGAAGFAAAAAAGPSASGAAGSAVLSGGPAGGGMWPHARGSCQLWPAPSAGDAAPNALAPQAAAGPAAPPLGAAAGGEPAGGAAGGAPSAPAGAHGSERALHSSLLRAWSSTISLESLDDQQGQAAAICSVCLCGFRDGCVVTALPCDHSFHRDCIWPWLLQQGRQATCPMCKRLVFAGSEP